ncbi:MAG TPA: hypothetical protein VK206_26700 [Anaerolineales bacterium]|nr:hypothetical protein [Anaerolineales bacterium]
MCSEKAPNTACSRRVGVTAVSGRLRGLKLAPANGVTSSRASAGMLRNPAHQRVTLTVGQVTVSQR